MPTQKKIKDPFLHARHLQFLRSRAQAQHRKEPWDLTEADWDVIWNQERFNQRGRSAESLCMIRIDYEDSWNRRNVAIIARRAALAIKNKKVYDLPYEHYLMDAIWIS